MPLKKIYKMKFSLKNKAFFIDFIVYLFYNYSRYISIGAFIMYIEKFSNNGKDYLRLVSNKRIINKFGIKTSTKKVEYNIGPLVKFDDGEPNYLERLKTSFKNGNPIIEELKQ